MIRLGCMGSTRSTVRCSIDLPPNTDMSCFGVLLRDKGQNLVPEPPARMTMYMESLQFEKNGKGCERG